MWPFFVYVHRRADDGRAFYVGKGSVHRDRCDRAHERYAGRSKWWKRVVAKHGFTVEIVAHFLAEEDAHEYERALIAEHGRLNLVNLTDGGEGCVGLLPSEQARAKLSDAASKPRSPVWVASIRRARKNGGNGGVVKRGDKLPEWWCERIAATKVGERNPMYGRTGESHPTSRRVVARDGVIYPSVKAAADATGVKMKTLYNMLSGHRPNRLGLRFA